MKTAQGSDWERQEKIEVIVPRAAVLFWLSCDPCRPHRRRAGAPRCYSTAAWSIGML